MLSLTRKTSILCINGVRIGSYCSTSLNANACTLDTTTRTMNILWDELIDMEKDLGIHIHKSLKVKEQVNYVVKKAN